MGLEKEIAKHLELIIPGVVIILKVLAWIIGIGFTSLAGVIGYVGRMWGKKISDQGVHIQAINHKLDRVFGTMAMCDGCSSAMVKYGRRRDDVEGITG